MAKPVNIRPGSEGHIASIYLEHIPEKGGYKRWERMNPQRMLKIFHSLLFSGRLIPEHEAEVRKAIILLNLRNRSSNFS
jgi:hypothetical protein